MYFIGFGFLLFGFLIIVNPALLAYIVAVFFILVGAHLLALGFHLSQKQREVNNSGNAYEKSFSFMGYEIIKRKK